MATQFTIRDLAREFDLTTRAIRFYEDMGLLRPERLGPGGRNRVYSARERARLRLTLRAKRLGLSLMEAKDIIDMTTAHATQCRSWKNSSPCWLSTENNSKTRCAKSKPI